MEPERKIEKLLRDYARKRREEAGSPPELDPATRRLLQGEVARRLGHKESGIWFARIFSLLRPRWIYATCGVAIVLLGVWLLVPGLGGPKKNKQLAYGKAESLQGTSPHSQRSAVAATWMTNSTIGFGGTSPRSQPPAETPPPKQAVSAKASAFQRQIADKTRTTIENSSHEAGNAKPGRTPELAGAKRQSVEKQQGKAEGLTAPLRDRRALGRSVVSRLAAGSSGPSSQTQGPQAVSLLIREQPILKTNAGQLVVTPTANPSTPLAQGGSGEKESRSGKSDVFFSEVPVAGATVREGSLNSPAAARFAGSNSMTDGQRRVQSVVQRFTQLAGGSPYALAGTNATPVLTSFEVEQSGARLRIVDEDGSVYQGYVERANRPPADHLNLSKTTTFTGTLAKQTERALDQKRVSQAFPGYFFRVTGTNRSSHQSVMFVGSVLPATNTAALDELTGTNAVLNGRFQRALARIPQLPLANSRINGTVVLDNRKEIQINAVPFPSQLPQIKTRQTN